MEKGYTRKASARILKEVLKFKSKASGNTTYDQAFVILMTEWDLELGVENNDIYTVAAIYRDGTIVDTLKLDRSNAYDVKEGDWDWTFIYKTVLEHIIKNKTYKRPKVSKRELNAKKKAEEAELKAKEKAAKLAEKERIKKEKELAKATKKTRTRKK